MWIQSVSSVSLFLSINAHKQGSGSLMVCGKLDKCNFGFFAKCDLSANKSRTHSGECNHQQELQVQPVIANDDDKKPRQLCSA